MPGNINMRRVIHDGEERQVFPLADLILRLGDELEDARRKAKEDGRPDLLAVKECSVEFGVTWTLTAEGKLEWEVVKLGGSVSREHVQTMTVTLTPLEAILTLQ